MIGLINEIHCCFKAYITCMHSQDLWHHGDQFGKTNCVWIARYVTWVAIDGILSLYIWYWCKISMAKNKLASGQIAVWLCSGSLRLERGCVRGKVQGKLLLLLPYLNSFGRKTRDLFPKHVSHTPFCGCIMFALLD